MAWIESHQSLATHRKTKAFARELKIDIPRAIGHLHLIWWWCLDNAPDGDLTYINPADLADAAMWKKDPDLLLQAMITAGFVDEIPEEFGSQNGATTTILLHDWGDYAGKLVGQRLLTRSQKSAGGQARMAKLTPEQRSALGKKAVAHRWGYQQNTSTHLVDDTSSIPATVPNTTQPTQQYSTVPTTTTPTPPPSKDEVVVVVSDNVFKLYTENIEEITPLVAEQLKDAVEFYGEEKVTEAIKIAVNANKKNWRYIEGTLKNLENPNSRAGPGSEKDDPDKYIKGKYGHLVNR